VPRTAVRYTPIHLRAVLGRFRGVPRRGRRSRRARWHRAHGSGIRSSSRSLPDCRWKRRDRPTRFTAVEADPKSGRRSQEAEILGHHEFTAELRRPGLTLGAGHENEVPRKFPPATPCEAAFGHILGTPTRTYTCRQWTRLASGAGGRAVQGSANARCVVQQRVGNGKLHDGE
jgi:hypothetical protein